MSAIGAITFASNAARSSSIGVVGQGGQRRRAERAGVVDQQVDLAGGGAQHGPVRRVGDVARQRGDVGAGHPGPDAVGRETQRLLVPGVNDKGVARGGEAGRQRPAQSAGCPGDECFLHAFDARQPAGTAHRAQGAAGPGPWS